MPFTERRPNVAGPWRRVLWSGGMDSTAHVLEVLAAGGRVEAFYAPTGDETWQKTRREIDARERIRAALPADWRRRLETRDPVPYDDETWKAHADAWDLVNAEAAGAPFSPQLPLLLGFPALTGPIAVGYVSTDRPLSRGDWRDLAAAAGLELPLIHLSKAETLARARRRGFGDLLALTWSCEAETEPIPCGDCSPCRHRLMPQTKRTR